MLAKEVALCLYRVAQECLRNIGNHAPNADIVRMSLSGSAEGVILLIEDTGDGFELDDALKKGGLGLISMAIFLPLAKTTPFSGPPRNTLARGGASRAEYTHARVCMGLRPFSFTLP